MNEDQIQKFKLKCVFYFDTSTDDSENFKDADMESEESDSYLEHVAADVIEPLHPEVGYQNNQYLGNLVHEESSTDYSEDSEDADMESEELYFIPEYLVADLIEPLLPEVGDQNHQYVANLLFEDLFSVNHIWCV